MVALHGTLDLILLRDLGFVTVLYGLSLSDLKSYEIPDGFILLESYGGYCSASLYKVL